jgi:hypothetical protein
MARYVVKNTVTAGGLTYQQGMTAELTPAQVSAIGAGNLRALVNPANSSGTVTYAGGGTSSYGTPAASQTHDLAGESAGVSNSA